MKKFWNDYVDLCKKSNRFYKKHWFCVIVLNVVSIAGAIAWLNRNKIKNRVKSKFKKEES